MLKPLKLQQLRKWGYWHVYLVAGLLASVCKLSLATVTLDTAWNANSRNITMRVGNAAFGSTPNTVTFNVNNANVSPSPSPILGIPDAGSTNAGGVANSVRIYVSNNSAQNRGNNIKVTANSSIGMTCVSSGCGATVIPFNTVSWVSSNLQTGANSGQDFASGSFSGSATQALINFDPPTYCSTGVIFLGICVFGEFRPYSATIFNDQVFTYNNSTLYPAGQYKGTVTYTATLP